MYLGILLVRWRVKGLRAHVLTPDETKYFLMSLAFTVQKLETGEVR